jgi:hypothetical protein
VEKSRERRVFQAIHKTVGTDARRLQAPAALTADRCVPALPATRKALLRGDGGHIGVPAR